MLSAVGFSDISMMPWEQRGSVTCFMQGGRLCPVVGYQRGFKRRLPPEQNFTKFSLITWLIFRLWVSWSLTSNGLQSGGNLKVDGLTKLKTQNNFMTRLSYMLMTMVCIYTACIRGLLWIRLGNGDNKTTLTILPRRYDAQEYYLFIKSHHLP